MNFQNLQQKDITLLTVNRYNNDPIRFLIKSIESSLSDYSDAYILVTGNIAVTKTVAAAGDNPIERNQPLNPAT